MDSIKPVLILGAGTVGKIAYDIFTTNDVVVYGFLDDDQEEGAQIDDVTVLGKIDDDTFFNLLGKDCDVFIASDETSTKENLVDDIKESRKLVPVNAIHSNSNISPTAFLGHGNLICKGALIGAFAKVGDHCIVHSNAIVDADVECGDYVQIGAGAVVNTKAIIGKGVFIGSGAIIVSGVKVGKGAKIGAGSIVISDVAAGKTYFGNPAKEI
jgi:sugar O-acyltransferase (sialic acid O-acetyltransferase NeuD family)